MAKNRKDIRRDIEKMLTTLFNALDGKETMGKCFRCDTLIPVNLPDCFSCVPPDCSNADWIEYQALKDIQIRDYGRHTIPLTECEEIDFSATIENMDTEADVEFPVEEETREDYSIYKVEYVKGLEEQVDYLKEMITRGDINVS